MACRSGWYKNKPGYKEIGAWGWDNDRLQSKIKPGLTDDDCTTWLGSMSPSGALFGAWKIYEDETRQQMSQARRFVWMSINNEDVTPYSVTMKCHNQRCCNPRHFEIKPTNRPDKKL
jgi:hypothetical protein